MHAQLEGVRKLQPDIWQTLVLLECLNFQLGIAEGMQSPNTFTTEASFRNHQRLVAPSIERLITREIIENKSTKIFDCSDPFSLDTKHQFEALIEFGSEFSNI